MPVRSVLVSFLILLAAAVPAMGQGTAVAGVYVVGAGRYLIVRGTDSKGISILDTRTGSVRNLTRQAEGLYTHGPARSRGTPVVGTVQFGRDHRVTWKSDALGELVASPLAVRRRDYTVETRDGAALSGTLYLPDRPGPQAVTVIVPLGDRFSLWEPAMWLLARGTGVFVYDQRGSGNSRGELYGQERNSHTLETLQLADDALVVVRHVRQFPGVDPRRVGILGWSTGGWAAAMAASRLGSSLAYYVNIAANANPWPEQAQHRFLARLQREGYSGTTLQEAEIYFEALRAVSDFRIGWQQYERVRDRYRGRQWYRTIIGIFPFFTYKEYGEALTEWSAETSPEVFFRRLSEVPALGIYFEFDQSNPPDSARRFQRALEAAGNPRVEVKIFPGVNHGDWVVDGYAFKPSEIQRRDPTVFEFVSHWIKNQVAKSEYRRQ